MQINKQIIILALPFLISACSSTTIIPEAWDQRTVIVHSDSAKEAVKLAKYKTGRICLLEEKSLKIIKLKVIYQGTDEKQEKLIAKAKTILPKYKTDLHYVPSDYLYKAALTFRCIKK